MRSKAIENCSQYGAYLMTYYIIAPRIDYPQQIYQEYKYLEMTADLPVRDRQLRPAR